MVSVKKKLPMPFRHERYHRCYEYGNTILQGKTIRDLTFS